MGTNCTHKKPEFEGELVVFESPHSSEVLLVDKAEYDKYGHLVWVAVNDGPEYDKAIKERARKYLANLERNKQPINTPDELANLRDEFRDCLEFVGDTADSHVDTIRPHNMTVAVEVMHSTDEYSLITGLSNQCVPVDGGFWAPALVFVPYAKLDHTKVTAGYGGKTW